MDRILKIMALFEHLLEPLRWIGGQEQALLACVPKIDIMEEREPAEAECTHRRIDGFLQIAKAINTRACGCKTRKILEAAAVSYPVRHRRARFATGMIARPDLSDEDSPYRDELRKIRNMRQNG